MVDQNSQFYAILTKVGAAKQANADALGIPWKITQMAVGDANLTDPMPDASWTSLINEWRRAPLSQLKVDDKDSAIIIAEQVIPAEVGGRWIREVALFDEDGAMVAVANCAPTYKPLLSQGSGRTQVVRMNLVVSSSSNVQLKIDPSVVLATREFVTEELAKQDFKHSVLVATTVPIVLSGLQTIDAVALPAGAAVLVKDQVAAKDNGLYVVAAGAWMRRADADSSAKLTPGLLVHVEKGAVNGDAFWQLVTDGPINLGVSALAFEMAFGRTGVVAGTYRSVTVDKYGRVVGATSPTTVAGYGLTDVYTNTQIDQALAAKAPLASPEFTGTPKAPTAPSGTNSTQVASTAFVQQEIAGDLATTAPLMDGTAAVGTSAKLAREDHRHPTDTTRAPLASPALTGIPTAPTAAAGANTTQLANTAFVQAAIAALVASSPATLDTLNEIAAALGNDPNFATTMLNALALKAPLDSPAFNGMISSTGSASVGTRGGGLEVGRTDGTAATAFVDFHSGTTVADYDARIHTTGGDGTSGRGDMVISAKTLSFGVAPSSGNHLVNKAALDAGLVLKAPLESPAFTGTPTVPTPAAGNSSKLAANTEFVMAAIASLVASSPAALDTLNELATAIGNDPNFSTTMLNALAGKVSSSDKASQVEAEGGTNDTKWMTALRVRQAIAKIVGVGLGQTWQDFTASRVAGTAYLNSTGRAIMVSTSHTAVTNTGAVQVSSNGTNWVSVGYSSPNAGINNSFVVPDGWYYRAYNLQTTSSWAELR